MTLMFFSLAGCDDKGESAEVKAIELDRQLALVNQNDKTSDRLHIVSGNGEYFIVYPKFISFGQQDVAYSKDIFAIHIENGNTIVVERKLLNESQIVSGLFVVADQKGSKRLFVVSEAYTTGLYDFDALETTYLNDANYWQ